MNAVLPLNRGDTMNIMMATETIDEGIGLEAIRTRWRTYYRKHNCNNIQLD